MNFTSLVPAARGDRMLGRAWLLTAVAALLTSGLFVLLIIASRMPVLGELFPLRNFFHLAIVVHVDFSVLIWFGAIGAALWSFNSRPGLQRLGQFALALVLAGSVLLAIAPFHPGEAIMSNYVPVLENAWFRTGLIVFAAGLVLAAVRQLLRPSPPEAPGSELRAIRFGVRSSAIVVLFAAAALVCSALAMPTFLKGPGYYEVLFWGGGHLLQIAWVQLMLVVWLCLAAASGLRLALDARWQYVLLVINFLPVLLAVWAYAWFEIGSPAHRDFFIWLMAAGGGLAAGPIGLAILHAVWRDGRAVERDDAALRRRSLRDGLVWSVILFGVGGGLGFVIDAGNTIVPAHYHGCIVAITLAFMLLCLQLAPQLGFGTVRPRLMRAMVWTYGPGQLLHIAGLAWSGGHGVQRKTAGAAQGLNDLAQILGMSVMGLGGLIAIIGGVLFLCAFGGALRRMPPARPNLESASGAQA